MGVSKVVLNGNVLVDLTGVTVEATNLVSPNTAIGADGEDVTGSLQAKTSSDLTVSGATVTAPAGVYSTDASKSVASGSATTPATTITANPSISVSSSGLITASNSKTQSVTPTVSAGYVSSGTAGTITVSGSNTSQLTTQAAQTKYPSTSDQTISSGRYLTGTQTFKGVVLTNLTAGNIKKDVVVKVGDSADDDRITSVTGTYEGGGGGGPDLPDPSTITTLNKTTWLLNKNVTQGSMPAGTISSRNPFKVLFMTDLFESGYDSATYFKTPFIVGAGLYWDTSWSAKGPATLQQYWDASSKTWKFFANVTFPWRTTGVMDDGSRVWTFTTGGGVDTSDNTNATLIEWMKANATLIDKE